MTVESRDVAGRPPREDLRRVVLECGFDRVGFAAAGRAPGADRLRDWLRRGFEADMRYMARSIERREDPRKVLDGARTVIAVALYYAPPGKVAGGPGRSGVACISSYARGRDYHEVLRRRLRNACEKLARVHPGAYRYHVDTGPVLEKDWAHAAGIGWIGKNTCVIHPRYGSYFFLGAILTTLQIDPDPPAADHCGSCRRCIDACPTGALVAPHELDSRRCISYLTIENRGAFPAEFAAGSGNLVFGCDICQDVCPFNRRAQGTCDPELLPRPENLLPSIEELATMDARTFLERFRGTPVLRSRFEGFLRNVMVALGNEASPESGAILRSLARRADVEASRVLQETLRCTLQRFMPSGPMHSPTA